MPVTISGEIKLSDLATEFGDNWRPHSLSEFYKGGDLVLGQTTVTSGPAYSPPAYMVQVVSGVNHFYWFNNLVATSSATTVLTGTSSGYQRAVYQGLYGGWPVYSIAAVSLPNFNVPTSGQIKLSNFYGARFVAGTVPVEVTFYESRYGSDMGTVSVVVVDNDTGIELGTLWTASGNLGVTTWYQRTTSSLEVESGKNIRIAFKHVAGSSYRADWAVDTVDIRVDGTSVRTSNFDTSSTTDGYGGWLAPTGTTNRTNAQDALTNSTAISVRTSTGISIFNIDSGGTPSGSTGPSGAQAGTYFAYSETSSYFSGTHWLFSPVITV